MEKPSLRLLPRTSLREKVYETLLLAIVDGELAPGERLRDEDLAAELGVSRTPVREALQRLEDEGLVQTFPGALTRVTPLDVRDASDVAPIVAALYAVAARAAVPRMTGHEIGELRRAGEAVRAAHRAGDLAEKLGANEAFHGGFVSFAGNEALRRAIDRHMARLRRLALALPGALAEIPDVGQIAEIMRAVEERDAVATADRVEASWLNLGARLAQGFEAAEGETFDRDDYQQSD